MAMNKTPDPVTIPIDGNDADARAYVTIHGDFITEKEFNEAMDRYFEVIAREINIDCNGNK